MKRTILSLTVGTMMLSLVGVGSASEVSPAMLRQAAKASEEARRAMARQQRAEAVSQAERAVLFNPTSADNRALLGQAYLQSGRFTSAETAFTDAMRLDANHGRAAFGLALAQIALGKTGEALAALEQARGRVPDADYGLGLALAGDRATAVTVLEAAARSEASTPKTRQNLALAYAMSGQWAEARATASQDISPEQVSQRMTEWARFSRPVGTADQVSSLLGVRPTFDPGLPTKLALLDAEPAQEQQAAVETPATPVAVPETTPEPVAAPLIARTEVPASTVAEPAAQPSFVMAKPEPVAPTPMYVAPVKAEAPEAVAYTPAPTPAPARVKSNFVIQLGAYSTEQRLEAAWNVAIKRANWLRGHDPFSTTFSAPADGRTLYRLSVSGFENRNEAVGLCRQIRERGGTCFVRAIAGDAPAQWVSRKAKQEYASR